jgi:hypothetical protein
MKANRDGIFRSAGITAFAALGACSCTSDRASIPFARQDVSATPPDTRMDPLDTLPARMGDLNLAAAGRVGASGVVQLLGKYQWRVGTPGSVGLTCTLPPKDEAECDRSRLQMAYGQGGKRRFEQLKKAAADGIPWTQKILAFTENTADREAIKRNREAGLMMASQRGNDQAAGLSHQLDGP